MRYASTFKISRLNTGTVPPLTERWVGNFILDTARLSTESPVNESAAAVSL